MLERTCFERHVLQDQARRSLAGSPRPGSRGRGPRRRHPSASRRRTCRRRAGAAGAAAVRARRPRRRARPVDPRAQIRSRRARRTRGLATRDLLRCTSRLAAEVRRPRTPTSCTHAARRPAARPAAAASLGGVGFARWCPRRSAAASPRGGDRSAALAACDVGGEEARPRRHAGRSRPCCGSPTAHRRLRAWPRDRVARMPGAGSICCAARRSRRDGDARLVFVPVRRSTARSVVGLAVAASDVADHESEPANTTNIESTTTRTTIAAKESYRAATAKQHRFSRIVA
ncbi:hypothetical protein SAMN02745121_03036 [Nannocystis exedens]|uniref:Uncharacterized protein n=1 Tax=Nannocystis exedens TaxID=54 RepID=A0A1I1XS23_9BACT|nr:hypothetical protein NAEX_06325 [Nannocystis exedens]SFE10094.1 hypothetical protein SAMN02745121_03036 [Nannocystis exedens]